MWRHRYSNRWMWHVQWTGTPELLNIRRGSALTKRWQEGKKKAAPPATSSSLFIGTEALKGLTSGASCTFFRRSENQAGISRILLHLFFSSLPSPPLHLALFPSYSSSSCWRRRRRRRSCCAPFIGAGGTGGAPEPRRRNFLESLVAAVQPTSLEYRRQQNHHLHHSSSSISISILLLLLHRRPLPRVRCARRHGSG